MSNYPVADAILSAAAPLEAEFLALVETLKADAEKSAKVGVKASDLAEAIAKSDDVEVKKIAKQRETLSAKIAELQKQYRDAAKSAQAILFPGSVAADTMDDEEKKEKIAHAASLRKNILQIRSSAVMIVEGTFGKDDTDETKNAALASLGLTDLPAVVGTRGRPAGFKSSTEGKPKPRISAATLDGKNVEPKATIGNIAKAIKATTGTDVHGDIVTAHFFEALGTENWQSKSGTTVEFPIVVDSDTNRTVTVNITV